MTRATTPPVVLKSWKVRTTTTGVVLTINGKTYDLGPSAHAIAFDIQRCANGWNPPERDHTV